jgi:zeaxanthin epoxidase
MPDGQAAYLRDIFTGWSKDIHHILNATKEVEIAQRDLYDLPPSVRKPWTTGPVALMGDSVHAMMPNLGQGGGQAIEDAFVISQELKSLKHRGEIGGKLDNYRSRRLIRSAAVQGLSRLASDIIVSTFDTPFKIVLDGGLKFENFAYNSVVTAMLKPVLPIFFKIQFNFLYEGWRNELAIDLKAGLGFLLIGGLILLIAGGFAAEQLLGLELGLEAIFGAEGFEGLLSQIQDFF